jgi:hypothetical protein
VALVRFIPFFLEQSCFFFLGNLLESFKAQTPHDHAQAPHTTDVAMLHTQMLKCLQPQGFAPLLSLHLECLGISMPIANMIRF